jgi:hypothetical protein
MTEQQYADMMNMLADISRTVNDIKERLDSPTGPPVGGQIRIPK